MSNFFTKEFLLEVEKGNIANHSLVPKWGHNDAIGSTQFDPVTRGGVYPTPQIAGAVNLRIKAGGNANDTAAGTGAREVTLEFISTTGALVIETLATAGVSASAATASTAIRLIRAYVSKSGVYATALVGSHVADIVIEDSGGVADWGTIEDNGFPRAQSEIGVYTVPTAHTAFLLGGSTTTDSAKITDILLFVRTGILQTAAPYDAMRSIHNEELKGGTNPLGIQGSIKVPGESDIGWMAKVDSGSGVGVHIRFSFLLIED